MYDVYGGSSIKGNLDLSKKIMEFDKTYEGARTIQYKLKKQGDIWRGEFFWESNFRGEVMCEIFAKEENPKLDWNDIVKRIELSHGGTEKWAKTVVKEMEQEGYIEIVKNPLTGEDVVKPLKR